MNAAMSSRRVFVPASESKMGGKAFSVFALIAGVVFMVLAAQFNAPLLAGVGFVGVAGSLMYLNTMFWCWMYESGRIRQPSRRNPPMNY